MAVRGRIKTPLTIDSLLQRVSEYDIYRHYLGRDFDLGRPILSPFRNERTPSFSINLTRIGELHHVDFGDPTKRGSAIDFVMQILNIDYGDALIRVQNDFNIGFSGDVPARQYNNPIAGIDRRERIFNVIPRRFTSDELAYWKLFHIEESELEANDVYSVRRLEIDGLMHPLPNNELVFAYQFGTKWKIYRPLSDKMNKWLGNVTGDTISGLHRMKPGTKIGIVTKSKKDEILLAKFLPAVCSVQSENTSAINSSNIALLKENCEKTYLNFDSDEIGVQACMYYNQFGFGWINTPRKYTKPDGHIIKDFSDLARYHGLQAVVDHFALKGLI